MTSRDEAGNAEGESRPTTDSMDSIGVAKIYHDLHQKQETRRWRGQRSQQKSSSNAANREVGLYHVYIYKLHT